MEENYAAQDEALDPSQSGQPDESADDLGDGKIMVIAVYD